MRPVSQRTKRMKEPRTTTPGSKDRWEMRISSMRRKMRAREDIATSNGKSLFFFFLSPSLSLSLVKLYLNWGGRVFYFILFLFM